MAREKRRSPYDDARRDLEEAEARLRRVLGEVLRQQATAPEGLRRVFEVAAATHDAAERMKPAAGRPKSA